MSGANAWDDGYPSGGNYWSDYKGTDVYGGPSQTEPGSDGVGDTAYFVEQDNQDHYPLMRPYRSLPWDITRDGNVGIDDIMMAALAYGSTLGQPRWNPYADVTHDRYVGIEDIFSIAQHFGI